MNTQTELIDRYFAAWNETDGPSRREIIARTWTDDAVYVDPMMRGEGQEGIDAMIAGVQAQFPGFRFQRKGEIDSHNDRVRFNWELGPSTGAAVAGGIDFGVIVGNHLQSVTGFLDFVPQPAE